MIVKLLQWWADRSRIEIISGHGDDTPYLIRYHLINNRFFKLYLHYFLRSDLDDPHDHPWSFWTWMVRGSYVEELYNRRTRAFSRDVRSQFGRRSAYRHAEDAHRIKVPTVYDVRKDNWKAGAPMTLFFAFKKRRDWGFIENYRTAPHWIRWDVYLSKKGLAG